MQDHRELVEELRLVSSIYGINEMVLQSNLTLLFYVCKHSASHFKDLYCDQTGENLDFVSSDSIIRVSSNFFYFFMLKCPYVLNENWFIGFSFRKRYLWSTVKRRKDFFLSF